MIFRFKDTLYDTKKSVWIGSAFLECEDIDMEDWSKALFEAKESIKPKETLFRASNGEYFIIRSKNNEIKAIKMIPEEDAREWIEFAICAWTFISLYHKNGNIYLFTNRKRQNGTSFRNTVLISKYEAQYINEMFGNV